MLNPQFLLLDERRWEETYARGTTVHTLLYRLATLRERYNELEQKLTAASRPQSTTQLQPNTPAPATPNSPSAAPAD